MENDLLDIGHLEQTRLDLAGPGLTVQIVKGHLQN